MKFKALLLLPFLLLLGSCGQQVAITPTEATSVELPANPGERIELGLKQQSTTCATTLQKQLDILTKGLLYLSESDYPFTSFQLPALQNLPSGSVDPAGSFTFATAVGLSGQPVTTQTLDEFFARLTEFRPGMTAAERRTAARYLMLEAFYKSRFTQTQVYRIGAIQVQVYVAGYRPGCGVVGVQTVSIET